MLWVVAASMLQGWMRKLNEQASSILVMGIKLDLPVDVKVPSPFPPSPKPASVPTHDAPTKARTLTFIAAAEAVFGIKATPGGEPGVHWRDPNAQSLLEGGAGALGGLAMARPLDVG